MPPALPITSEVNRRVHEDWQATEVPPTLPLVSEVTPRIPEEPAGFGVLIGVVSFTTIVIIVVALSLSLTSLDRKHGGDLETTLAFPLEPSETGGENRDHKVQIETSVLKPHPPLAQPNDDNGIDRLPDIIASAEAGVVRINVQKSNAVGSGTGVLVDNNGMLVTNFHVVRGAITANAVFYDGKVARVLGFLLVAPEIDLVVLKISMPAGPYKPLHLASRLPRKGERVVALGMPKGLEFSALSGIVSAVRTMKEIASSSSEYEILLSEYSANATWIQTDAPISPGNSGGPLINMHGEVVGLNTLRLSQLGLQKGENLNFAIASTEVAAKLGSAKGRPQALRELPGRSSD